MADNEGKLILGESLKMAGPLDTALQWARDIADEARKPGVLKIPGTPSHLQYIAMPGGELVEHFVKPPLRYIHVGRLDDLIALGKSPMQGVKPDAVMCVYTDTCVELIFDQQDGRERAYLPLRRTHEFDFFAERCQEPAIGVAELREAFEVKLRKTYRNTKLVEQISTLASTNRTDASHSVNYGKESLGASVLNEAKGGDAGFPDPYQEFSVRAYANADLDIRNELQCILKPNVKSVRWHLEPLEDSWLAMCDSILTTIRERLIAGFKDTPVRVIDGQFFAQTGN